VDVGALAVAGFGNGLFTPAFFTGALDQVQPQETGSAAGLLNAVQQLGGTIGVAVLGGIYLAATTNAAGAAQQACWAAAAAVVATTVSVVVMTRRPSPAGERRP
jgi:predicted MFS family arabinose efflux permease